LKRAYELLLTVVMHWYQCVSCCDVLFSNFYV